MAIRYTNTQLGPCGGACGSHNCCCLDKLGCPCNVCPDFTIRRNDTMPPLRICVDECGVPLALEGRVLEVSMWATAKIKTALLSNTTTISLADNIGFYQAMVGDTIIVDHPRSPERMVITTIDEDGYTFTVTRGASGTVARAWKRGTRLRIFRILNAPAVCEVSYVDIPQVDGTILKDQRSDSVFVYEWRAGDTSLAGCFWLEFKLLKMTERTYYTVGGVWEGAIHEDLQKYFHTGTTATDSTVLLSFETVTGEYYIPDNNVWTGAVHVGTDGRYYTGTLHDDGSVVLDTNGIPSSADPVYTISSQLGTMPPAGSLGLGVEWARRFPVDGEGFLIKITESPGTEI